MDHLLRATDRAGEVPQLAEAYAFHMLRRAYLRWHPRALVAQRVEGIEHLLASRDAGQGVLLSFAHHHQYDGLFGSLARHGVEIFAVMLPEMMAPDAPVEFRQHKVVCERGATLVSSGLGTAGLQAYLEQGKVLALASDVPGRTEVTFLGRRVVGSFGAARMAVAAGSPVVVVTSHRDGDGHHLRVHPPLVPADHDGPGALLDAILELHGAAILAWPEAFESPLARFGDPPS